MSISTQVSRIYSRGKYIIESSSNCRGTESFKLERTELAAAGRASSGFVKLYLFFYPLIRRPQASWCAKSARRFVSPPSSFDNCVSWFLTPLEYPQKLSKVAAPDPFTATSSSVKDGSRKIGENKLLSRPGSSKNRFQVSSCYRYLPA